MLHAAPFSVTDVKSTLASELILNGNCSAALLLKAAYPHSSGAVAGLTRKSLNERQFTLITAQKRTCRSPPRVGLLTTHNGKPGLSTSPQGELREQTFQETASP